MKATIFELVIKGYPMHDNKYSIKENCISKNTNNCFLVYSKKKKIKMLEDSLTEKLFVTQCETLWSTT